jgi:hypothetical protein
LNLAMIGSFNPGTIPMTQLRDYLLDAYGGCADKRIKDRSLDRPIQMDDKGRHDVYQHFCSIFVKAPRQDERTFILTLNNSPLTPKIRQLVEARGGTIAESSDPARATITIRLTTRCVSFLNQLARTYRSAVFKGRRYADPQWKWICPRTSNSLERLAVVLDEFNQRRRSRTSPVTYPDPEVEDDIFARLSMID